jgi:hypothetical protein
MSVGEWGIFMDSDIESMEELDGLVELASSANPGGENRSESWK